MRLNKPSPVVILFFALFLNGCAEKVYYNGSCVTCGLLASSDQKAEVNYKVFYRSDQVMQYILLNNIAINDLHAHDYLVGQIGNRITSLQKNEFQYNRELVKAKKNYVEALSDHQLDTIYQYTAPEKLGKYDFAKSLFQIGKSKGIKSDGGNLVIGHPRTTFVTFINAERIPDLDLNPSEAEKLRTKVGRHIYVRYVFKLLNENNTATNFDAELIEIHYIDVGPNINTQKQKEAYRPFKKVVI